MRDAFGHLMAIGADPGGQALSRNALIVPDAGVSDIADPGASIADAETRQWDREASVRTLA